MCGSLLTATISASQYRTSGSHAQAWFYLRRSRSRSTCLAMEIRIIKTLLLVAIWMGVAFGSQAQTVVEYVHTDALGTPVAITNAAGTVIERSVYEPYGTLINRPLTDGPGFTGHVQDTATGLTYMQQRYYDPIIGRFLSVDPVTAYGSGDMRHFNVYAYAYNNPYKFTDPDGRAGNESFNETMQWGDADYVRANTLSYEDAKTGLKVVGAVAGAVAVEVATTKGLGLVPKAVAAYRAHKAAQGLAKAKTARDALTRSLRAEGKTPATVTGGVNNSTGEVAARACGGGKCAEDHVSDALGGPSPDIKFTPAQRPRTGEQVPVCERCEGKYGRDAFPDKDTRFKSDK